MATSHYSPLFRDITGAVEKHGIINRRKHFRTPTGKVFAEGVPEAYAVRHPRDFKRNPMKNNELIHHNRWKQACLTAFEQLHDTEMRALWMLRFNNQKKYLDELYASTGKAAYMTHKKYIRFDAFVRACIYIKQKQQDMQAM